VKNGKRNEKIKRKRISCLAGPGGNFGPPRRERGRGWRPSWPNSEGGGTAGDGAVARRPHASEGGGFNGADGNGGRGSTGVRSAVEFRGGSPSWVRFCGGEAVARHGRGQGITGVGSI
jgi:hypothetical protein